MVGRKRMLAFHREYPDPGAFGQQPAARLAASAKVPQPAAQLPEPLLWSVPWAHHVILMDMAGRRGKEPVNLKSPFVISSWGGIRRARSSAAACPAGAIVQPPVAQLPRHQNGIPIEKADASGAATDCCPRQLSGSSGQLDLATTRVPQRGCGNLKEFGHGG